MNRPADVVLVVVVLLNFFMLGSSRHKSLIQCARGQGLLLGVLPIVAHGASDVRTVAFGVLAMVLKGGVIPAMLSRALRDVGIRREVEPIVGYVASLLLVGAATALSVLFASTLPLAPEHAGSLLVPASLATLMSGFLILTTRRTAITQVVGYLTLENGVFIFGLALLGTMPLLVEGAVLLDVLVGIFVMGIIIDHIQREFSSIDTEQLSELRD